MVSKMQAQSLTKGEAHGCGKDGNAKARVETKVCKDLATPIEAWRVFLYASLAIERKLI